MLDAQGELGVMISLAALEERNQDSRSQSAALLHLLEQIGKCVVFNDEQMRR